MPYKTFKRGDRWCVYKIDDSDSPVGKTLGCHPSEGEANSQVRALYANEADMDKATNKDMDKADKVIIEKEKSLDEQSMDVWNSMYDLLNSDWWIVKIFPEYLILYYNDKYYQVSYSYGDDDKIAIPDQSSWTEVKQEWVAKTMNSLVSVSKLEVKIEDSDECADCDDENDNIEFNVAVIEKSDKKQITYSVVYEPDTVDTQSDSADMEEIEKMAHNFLKNHLISVKPAADLNHEKELDLEDAIPVESYIAPTDFEMGGQMIKKGSWVLAMHIPNTEIWEMVEKGEITGYSLRGRGLRIPV